MKKAIEKKNKKSKMKLKKFSFPEHGIIVEAKNIVEATKIILK